MTVNVRTEKHEHSNLLARKFRALSLIALASSLIVFDIGQDSSQALATGPISNLAGTGTPQAAVSNVIEVRARPRVRRSGIKVARYNNRYRARRVARNVAIGVGTAAVVSGSYRYRYTCSELARQCNNGSLNACFDYDSRCY